MSVTLKRSTELVGAFLKFKVWMNNEHLTKIAQGEEKEFAVPKENSVMQIKQLNGKSNKLVVNDGDTVEITNGPGLLIMFVLCIMLVPIATLFDGTTRIVSSIIVILGFFLVLQLANTYKLEKLDDSGKS